MQNILPITILSLLYSFSSLANSCKDVLGSQQMTFNEHSIGSMVKVPFINYGLYIPEGQNHHIGFIIGYSPDSIPTMAVEIIGLQNENHTIYYTDYSSSDTRPTEFNQSHDIAQLRLMRKDIFDEGRQVYIQDSPPNRRFFKASDSRPNILTRANDGRLKLYDPAFERVLDSPGLASLAVVDYQSPYSGLKNGDDIFISRPDWWTNAERTLDTKLLFSVKNSQAKVLAVGPLNDALVIRNEGHTRTIDSSSAYLKSITSAKGLQAGDIIQKKGDRSKLRVLGVSPLRNNNIIAEYVEYYLTNAETGVQSRYSGYDGLVTTLTDDNITVLNN